MDRKSLTCMNRRTGKPLTEYDSEYEAIDAAEYVNRTYRLNLVPYKCHKCGLWHLSPKNRQTPSKKCYNCLDAAGAPKDLYRTREIAERRAEILYYEKGVSLNIYKCPYANGWHLTKK